VNHNANDPKTGAELMERYGTAIRRYFARRVHDRSDVEDLTRQVFERLLKRAALTSILNVQGHLFQITADLLAEWTQTMTRRTSVMRRGGSHDVANPADPEDSRSDRTVPNGEASARMVIALWELPARVRAVFVLSRFEEMRAREIAARLNLSIGAVEQDMQRAIKRLRDSLK
jgi:RNA polymerase sigma-70 factor (ECF subfamily)